MIIRILCYLLPLPIIYGLSFLGGVMTVYGISEFFITIFAFPVFEELFKFLCSRKARTLALGIIISYAIFEFILVKIPLFDLSLGRYNIDLAFVSMVAIIFHIGTAFCYLDKKLQLHSFITLAAMSVFHITYNYVGDMNIQYLTMLFFTVILSVSPFMYLFIMRFLVRT